MGRVRSDAWVDFYAAVCAIREAVRLKSLGKGFGEELRIVVWVDALETIGGSEVD